MLIVHEVLHVFYCDLQFNHDLTESNDYVSRGLLLASGHMKRCTGHIICTVFMRLMASTPSTIKGTFADFCLLEIAHWFSNCIE